MPVGADEVAVDEVAGGGVGVVEHVLNGEGGVDVREELGEAGEEDAAVGDDDEGAGFL